MPDVNLVTSWQELPTEMCSVQPFSFASLLLAHVLLQPQKTPHPIPALIIKHVLKSLVEYPARHLPFPPVLSLFDLTLLAKLAPKR